MRREPPPAPDPWPEQVPGMTDLQYAVYICGLSIEAAAHHTGQNPGRIRKELSESGPPPGFTDADAVRFLQ